MAEIRFGAFRLDPHERLLRRDDQRLELNGRYFDALLLLVRAPGRLVSKERFHQEVWRGVPVTDEALTQCIRSLRRLLGDSAERPAFIETIPKHGYRFIAPVAVVGWNSSLAPGREGRAGDLPWLFAAGVVGAGLAGLTGGLIYGLTSDPGGADSAGSVSVLLVLVCVCTLTALLGGVGVVGGMMVAERLAGPRSGWLIVGGAMGGWLIGTVTKLLGIDAFNVLIGRAPLAMAGGVEGLLLGGGVGLGAWFAATRLVVSLRRTAGIGLIAGAAAGLAIAALGRGLMANSLAALSATMPDGRLEFAPLSDLLGELGFGVLSRWLTTTAEAGLFTAAIMLTLGLARRQRGWP